MRRLTICVLAGVFAIGCAGTDPPDQNGVDGPNGDPNNTSPNQTPNGDPNGDPNATPNGDPNAIPNGDPNAMPNGDPNAMPNAMPNNTINPNNADPEWRALVANADLTGDTSTWNIVVFDGAEASVTLPQAFGAGSIAVAASGDRGYVVDLDSGMVLVIDAVRGTEIETIDLGVTDLDSASASEGILVAASGPNSAVAQYSSAGGGIGQSIPLPAPGGGATQFVRSVSIFGNVIAGVLVESAMFPTTPQIFLADPQSATLIDADPTSGGRPTIGVSGLNRLDRMAPEQFAVATDLDGILILRKDGAAWLADQTLIPRSAFADAEVWEVVMANESEGVAFTYDSGFAAWIFDADAGTADRIDGFALPSGLIGGDASADGAYYFLGDYGIRDMQNTPWGVGVVDAAGNLVDHVQTDDTLPPIDIVALN